MGRVIANDPSQQFRFSVAIEGMTVAGFTKVDGLESELEVVEYREGGSGVTKKLPGIEKTGAVTLEKGAFKDKDLYDWFKKVATQADFRKTVTITEQNRLGASVRTWNLYESWASKITMPSLDASSSEVNVESIEIQFETLD